MNELWSAIPIGTVAQRPRAFPAPPARSPAPPAASVPSAGASAAPGPSVALAGSVPPRSGALDAPTVAVDEDPTNRLSAHLLATRAAAPTRVASPVATPARRPLPPDPPPARPVSPPRSLLPCIALAALLSVAVAVLAPWAGSGPWVASSPVGLAVLTGIALLTAPVTVDLLTGRDRAPSLLLGLPLMTAAAAGTVVASGSHLADILTAQGLDGARPGAAGVLAAALLGCLLVGIVGATRRPRSGSPVSAPAVVVGISAAVSVLAVSALVIAVGGPAPQTATVATATGATPTAAVTAGAGPACPAEAASTLSESTVGAPVVAHDSRVHIAICQGLSGALYYYGADDRTHLTITLPASRSEDSWIATNNGVTYSITPQNLIITRAAVTLADESLTSGWTR